MTNMKILIVRLGSLGDIVHTIPAQQQIAEHFPHAQIHWLAEPPYQSLLRQVPGIFRLWAADTKKVAQEMAHTPRTTQPGGFAET